MIKEKNYNEEYFNCDLRLLEKVLTPECQKNKNKNFHVLMVINQQIIAM